MRRTKHEHAEVITEIDFPKMEKYLSLPNDAQIEGINNSLQAKIAELLVGRFFSKENQQRTQGDNFYTSLTYISYNEIREDKYKKSCPFNAIIYPSTKPLEYNLTESQFKERIKIIINDGINKYGNLSTDTREVLNEMGIKTITISSTKINQKRTEILDEVELIENIREDDFFNRPLFCKSSPDINNYKQYLKYVSEKHYKNKPIEKVEKKIIEEEIKASNDIFIRVYMQEEQDRCFIMGYIHKCELYRNPCIQKLFKTGKLKDVLYFTKPLTHAHQMSEIFIDKNIKT